MRTSVTSWFLFFAALLARIVGFFAAGNEGDDTLYAGIAQNILDGLGPAAFQDFLLHSWMPPVPAYLAAASMGLFDGSWEPLRAVLIVWSAASCVLLGSLGASLMGPKGKLAGWIWALYPPQIFWSTQVNAFTIAVNALILALWLIVRYHETKKEPILAAAGLLWAVLALSRGENSLAAGVMMLWLLWSAKKLRPAFIFMGFFVLGLSPWVIRNWKIHRQFVPLTTNYGDNFWFTFNSQYRFTGHEISKTPELYKAIEGKSEIERADILMADAKRYIKENPARALYIWAGNLVLFWRPYLSPEAVPLIKNLVYIFSYVPLFIFFLLGLKNLPLRKQPLWLIPVSLIAYKWFIHSFFYSVVHFRESIVTMIMLIAAKGLTDFMPSENREALHG